MWCGHSCATAYLLTGAQHILRAWIVHVDRKLFNQIMISEEPFTTSDKLLTFHAECCLWLLTGNL